MTEGVFPPGEYAIRIIEQDNYTAQRMNLWRKIRRFLNIDHYIGPQDIWKIQATVNSIYSKSLSDQEKTLKVLKETITTVRKSTKGDFSIQTYSPIIDLETRIDTAASLIMGKSSQKTWDVAEEVIRKFVSSESIGDIESLRSLVNDENQGPRGDKGAIVRWVSQKLIQPTAQKLLEEFGKKRRDQAQCNELLFSLATYIDHFERVFGGNWLPILQADLQAKVLNKGEFKTSVRNLGHILVQQVSAAPTADLFQEAVEKCDRFMRLMKAVSPGMAREIGEEWKTVYLNRDSLEILSETVIEKIVDRIPLTSQKIEQVEKELVHFEAILSLFQPSAKIPIPRSFASQFGQQIAEALIEGSRKGGESSSNNALVAFLKRTTAPFSGSMLTECFRGYVVQTFKDIAKDQPLEEQMSLLNAFFDDIGRAQRSLWAKEFFDGLRKATDVENSIPTQCLKKILDKIQSDIIEDLQKKDYPSLSVHAEHFPDLIERIELRLGEYISNGVVKEIRRVPSSDEKTTAYLEQVTQKELNDLREAVQKHDQDMVVRITNRLKTFFTIMGPDAKRFLPNKPS